MAEKDKSAYEAELIAQGYDPAKAAEMAEAAMLSTEYDWAKQGMQGLGKDYGIRTGGRYGTYVANPGASFLGGMRAGQSMMEVPDIIERGQEGTRSWLDMLGGASDEELGVGADPTAATVDALRTPDRPGADVGMPSMPTPDFPGADVGGPPMGMPGPGAQPSPMAAPPPGGMPRPMGSSPIGALPRRPGETDQEYAMRLRGIEQGM